VHYNSGIINKAFVLMVQGGVHPASGVEVPAIDSDFDASLVAAAEIFYQANTNCLTEGSDFASARSCTLQFASESQTESLAKAWDAVGVLGGGGDSGSGNGGTPAPAPTDPPSDSCSALGEAFAQCVANNQGDAETCLSCIQSYSGPFYPSTSSGCSAYEPYLCGEMDACPSCGPCLAEDVAWTNCLLESTCGGAYSCPAGSGGCDGDDCQTPAPAPSGNGEESDPEPTPEPTEDPTTEQTPPPTEAPGGESCWWCFW
jgi:hypothetical protein